jgi:nitrous oxidase accessory protein
MFNNIFTENWGDAAYGLFLKEISDSYIFGNKFFKNTEAITWKEPVELKLKKIFLKLMVGE